jgi:hypothetical protein
MTYARGTRALALAGLALVLARSLARADAIMGPPEDCAPGSQAMSSHWGQWCEDTTCTSDDDCPALVDLGARTTMTRLCRRASVCVPHGTTAATGPRTLESPRGAYRGPGRAVTGACAADGTCREGVCDTAPRCVIQATPVLAAPATTPPATTTSPPPTTPQPPSAPPPAPSETTMTEEPSSSGSCSVARGSDDGPYSASVLGSLATLGALVRRPRGDGADRYRACALLGRELSWSRDPHRSRNRIIETVEHGPPPCRRVTRPPS